MTKIVSNGVGQPVGRITYMGNDERSSGTCFDRVGTLLGRYSAGTDTTYDKNGNPFGKGNLMEALIRCAGK